MRPDAQSGRRRRSLTDRTARHSLCACCCVWCHIDAAHPLSHRAISSHRHTELRRHQRLPAHQCNAAPPLHPSARALRRPPGPAVAQQFRKLSLGMMHHAAKPVKVLWSCQSQRSEQWLAPRRAERRRQPGRCPPPPRMEAAGTQLWHLTSRFHRPSEPTASLPLFGSCSHRPPRSSPGSAAVSARRLWSLDC